MNSVNKTITAEKQFLFQYEYKAKAKMKKVTVSEFGRSVTSIPDNLFYQIRSFILNLLEEEKEITLNELLKRTETISNAKEAGDSLIFFVIKIKQYLEVHEIIKVKRNIGPSRQQIIRLGKNKYSRYKM